MSLTHIVQTSLCKIYLSKPPWVLLSMRLESLNDYIADQLIEYKRLRAVGVSSEQ